MFFFSPHLYLESANSSLQLHTGAVLLRGRWINLFSFFPTLIFDCLFLPSSLSLTFHNSNHLISKLHLLLKSITLAEPSITQVKPLVQLKLINEGVFCVFIYKRTQWKTKTFKCHSRIQVSEDSSFFLHSLQNSAINRKIFSLAVKLT